MLQLRSYWPAHKRHSTSTEDNTQLLSARGQSQPYQLTISSREYASLIDHTRQLLYVRYDVPQDLATSQDGIPSVWQVEGFPRV